MGFFAMLLIAFISSGLAEIFIDYSDLAGEGQMLYRFFHDIEDGYFVDFGAYDPFYHSNTLNLEVMGW